MRKWLNILLKGQKYSRLLIDQYIGWVVKGEKIVIELWLVIVVKSSLVGLKDHNNI